MTENTSMNAPQKSGKKRRRRAWEDVSARSPGTAGVAQWQSPSLPSWPCRFDPGHPLHRIPVLRAGIRCGTRRLAESFFRTNVDKD